ARLLERRDADEPRNGVLLSMKLRLRSPGLAGDNAAGQPRLAGGAAIFVDDFPETRADEFDVGGIHADIGKPAADMRCRRKIGRRAAVAIDDLPDKAWLVGGAAIGYRRVRHDELE